VTSELRPPGWYPHPAGQPGQKYWDGQTCQATAPPTTPAVRKPKTWIKRLGIAAAVVLAALVGAESGGNPFVDWGDPGGGTDPEDGADPEDERDGPS
jgi:hypothetical protein